MKNRGSSVKAYVKKIQRNWLIEIIAVSVCARWVEILEKKQLTSDMLSFTIKNIDHTLRTVSCFTQYSGKKTKNRRDYEEAIYNNCATATFDLLRCNLFFLRPTTYRTSVFQWRFMISLWNDTKFYSYTRMFSSV